MFPVRAAVKFGYIRGAEDAYRRLGGDDLVGYIRRCDVSGSELDPAEIDRLIAANNG